MSEHPKRRRTATDFALSSGARGTLMFLSGLALTIREALLHGPERPSLYILFGGMMGLPLVWGNRKDPPDDKERPS